MEPRHSHACFRTMAVDLERPAICDLRLLGLLPVRGEKSEVGNSRRETRIECQGRAEFLLSLIGRFTGVVMLFEEFPPAIEVLQNLGVLRHSPIDSRNAKRDAATQAHYD